MINTKVCLIIIDVFFNENLIVNFAIITNK